MPGIVFLQIWSPIPPQEKKAAFQKMAATLTHTAWHRSQVMYEGTVGMGRVTTGILNPSPQPRIAQKLSIVFDGELCGKQGDDHVPGQNDPDLILRLYRQGRVQEIEQLNGSFSFILWDARERCVIAMTDRYSSRPLYYSITHLGIGIASEAKAILASGLVEPKVNETALAEFFAFRHPLDDRTLVRNLKLLPPAGRLVGKQQAAQIDQYWHPPHYDENITSLRQCLEPISSLLKQAVARSVDGPSTAVALSGGLDSRLLSGAASEYIDRPDTFSHGRSECLDHIYAEEISQIVGSKHHRLNLPNDFLPSTAPLGVWLTDGLMTCIDFYALKSAPAIHKIGMRTVLYGLAGPLGGIAFKPDIIGKNSYQATEKISDQFAVYIPEALQTSLFSQSLLKRVQGAPTRGLIKAIEELKGAPPSYQVEYFCHRFRWPRTGFYGPQSIRSWVEIRLPYYDYELYENTYRIPLRLRSSRKLQIALLKHLYPKLARVPWTYTSLPVNWSFPFVARFIRGSRYLHKKLYHLTEGIIAPPRHEGQADYANWFRTVLRPWLEAILLDDRTLSRDILNPSFVKEMIEDHMQRRWDYSVQFGLLLTFELWCRIFIDGEKPSALAEISYERKNVSPT